MTLAAECFEKILDKEADNFEALKTLAWIYAKTDSKSKTAKAIEYLRKVRSGMALCCTFFSHGR